MDFKIDTKERFTVVMPLESVLSDNMTADLNSICLPFLEKEVKNLVLNLKEVKSIENGITRALAVLQQSFYEGNASFVVCEVGKTLNETFEKEDIIDILNQTPTESEAWDIVQMEEIERELMDGFDMEFEKND